MPAFRAKGFVCQSCKKLISYSPDQEGKTIDCPRCGEPAEVPSGGPAPLSGEGAAPSHLPLRPARRPQGSRRSRLTLYLALGGIVCAGILTGLLLTPANKRPALVDEAVKRLVAPLAAHDLVAGVAQTPITVRGSDITVNVTQVSRSCPKIYQSAIRTTTPTESPVFCVTVVIANNGESPVPYRTWRRIESESDLRQAATLQDEAGVVLGSLSFGPETWPAGTQQRAVIQPGAALTDTLMFENRASVSGDCLLALPGENLGKGGKIRFRIPAAMIR